MTFADFNLIGTIPVSKEALNKISRGSAIIFLSSFSSDGDFWRSDIEFAKLVPTLVPTV